MTKGMTVAELGQIVTGTTGILLLAFAGYGLANLRYKVPGTAFFIALCLAGAVWSFAYVFEKSQVVVEGFMAAARLEYVGLAYIPSLWLLVALSWMEHPWAKLWRFRLLVLGISTLLLIIVSTNDLHHWWYASIVPTGERGFARFWPGPLYYSFATLYLSTFFLSTVLLLLRRTKTPLFSRKATVIIGANLFPVVFSIAYQLGFRPGGLDLTLFSLVPAFFILAWGLFRHDIIRIVPIARETVVESLEQAVLVIDTEGRLVDHNGAAATLLPHLPSTLLQATSSNGEITVTVEGKTRTYRHRRSPVIGSAKTVQGVVILLTDVTEEKRLLEELAHQATHDALTGLANRKHFEEQALGEITRAHRHGGTLAIVLFDLDGFKAINDRFGHSAGDKVLKSVAAVVGPRLRPYDLLARIGGEEFAVLMPEAQPVEAKEAAERWRLALEKTPQILPGAVLHVTASFGVTSLNDLPVDISTDARLRLDALLTNADRALYRAKAEGWNRVL